MIFNQAEKKLVKPPLSKDFVSSFILNEKDCDCETIVITSYSIHYTKLYEIPEIKPLFNVSSYTNFEQDFLKIHFLLLFSGIINQYN